MESYPTRKDKKEGQSHLRPIDDTYVFDQASGLYEPKPIAEQSNRQRHSYRTVGTLPIQIRRDWLVIVISIITLAVIGEYTEFSKRQWIATEKSAKAAKDAAQAARDSVDQAQAAAHLDQRAWVSVVGIEGVPELDKSWTIGMRARNTGRTFAKDFHMSVIGDPMPKGTVPDFSAEEAKVSKTISSTGVLSPNGDFVATINAEKPGRTFSQIDKDAITNGDIKEFSFGRLWYKDVFNCPHWTTYCFQLGTDLKWSSCKEYNSADDDTCQEKKK